MVRLSKESFSDILPPMSDRLVIPAAHREILDPRETERAILRIKESFQTNLAFELNLVRVTAPLFVESGTGVNDDLNGVERPVAFAVRHLQHRRAEIVQSLAKWKRLTLAELGFAPGEGIYADMNAVRPDEELDNTHSLYVDQWDWELGIEPQQRTSAFLHAVVRKIYDVIRRTERYICHQYGDLKYYLPDEISIIHSEELLQRYPWLGRNMGGVEDALSWEITFSRSGMPLRIEPGAEPSRGPELVWVRESAVPHAWNTRDRLTGTGSRAGLSASGLNYVRLVAGDF